MSGIISVLREMLNSRVENVRRAAEYARGYFPNTSYAVRKLMNFAPLPPTKKIIAAQARPPLTQKDFS